MKVNIAKHVGFCEGVQRAFVLVEKQFKNKTLKGQVLILGSLVHNNNVMNIIEKWGIKKIKSIRPVKKGDTVIITAHGVSKKRIDTIKKRGAKVFDATCPKVSKVHRNVFDRTRKNFQVMIFGDKFHKEVKGIKGWSGGQVEIVDSIPETKELAQKIISSRSKRSLLLVSQTTQNVDDFNEVTKKLKDATKMAKRKFEVMDTICRTTEIRQKEVANLAKGNDAVIVVGGKSSANTKQLCAIAKKINQKVVWIEQLDKFAKRKIKRAIKRAKSIGIVSGASTPSWDIDKVAVFLKSL